eukprot:scaffold57702_cov27-Tisochrysis_lutea.AAC.2
MWARSASSLPRNPRLSPAADDGKQPSSSWPVPEVVLSTTSADEAFASALAAVRDSRGSRRDSPMSISFIVAESIGAPAWGSASNRTTLPGLMSRCTIRRRCKWSMAWQSWRITFRASGSLTAPRVSKI